MLGVFGFGRNGRRNRVARLLASNGDRERDAGNWKAASELYRDALSKDPGMSHIWVQYGHSLKETGQLASAWKAYVTAFEQEPDNADTALQLGHCAKLLGDKSLAIQWYTEAFRLDPDLSDPERELTALNVQNHTISTLRSSKRALKREVSFKSRPIFLSLKSGSNGVRDQKWHERYLYNKHVVKVLACDGGFGVCIFTDDSCRASLCPTQLPDEILCAPTTEPNRSLFSLPIPAKAVVVIPLEEWLGSANLGPILRDLRRERDIFPVLLIDEDLSFRAREKLLRRYARQFIEARRTAVCTLAPTEDTVSMIDTASPLSQRSFSSIEPLTFENDTGFTLAPGRGEIVIAASHANSPSLTAVLEAFHIAGIPNDSYRVFLEEAARDETPKSGGPSLLDTAEAAANLKLSKLFILTDECQRSFNWAGIAFSHQRPVIMAANRTNFRVWGRRPTDYIDFGSKESLQRLIQLVKAVDLSKVTAEGSRPPRNPFVAAIGDSLRQLSQTSWLADTTIPMVNLGKFYGLWDGIEAVGEKAFEYGGPFTFGDGWKELTKEGIRVAGECRLMMQLPRNTVGSLSVKVLIASVGLGHDDAHFTFSARHQAEKTLPLRAGEWKWLTLEMPISPDEPLIEINLKFPPSVTLQATVIGFAAFNNQTDAEWFEFLTAMGNGGADNLLMKLDEIAGVVSDKRDQ